MVPASPSLPIPLDLRQALSYPQIPWNISSQLFARIKSQSSDQPFKLCEVLSSDPEYNFILKYFEHQKPAGYSIKRVVCIHNADHTQVFEGTLKNIEREANNPFFAPKGKDEEPKVDRTRALSRWQAQASQFSPVEIKSSGSREADKCFRAKVLPLWHGSSQEVYQSVFSSGFTYFGKQDYFDESASKGTTKNTDIGYFGSGIYFTNSAQYASKYSSGGHLILAWVSMREPYPVVNDQPHPEKGSDMKKLKGQKHYQNYNAHFIPVASIKPQDPQCLVYYPCYQDQQPAWDEFVVFEKAQTLPRFWIELGVDFPKVVLSELGTVGELLTLLLNLLSKVEIQQHVALAQMLQAKLNFMLEQAETHSLGLEDQKFLKLAKRLFAEGGKFNSATVNMLLKLRASPPTTSPAAAPVKVFSPPLSVASLAPVLSKAPVNPSLPAVAFGKELWDQYLGDVGEEPPLPADIEEILKSPCPFFPDKRVEETHLLILIPKTVNGKLLTLNYLEDLVQKPKLGQPTRYAYSDQVREEYGEKCHQDSYWVLMTRDILPGSLGHAYDQQVDLLKETHRKKGVHYEVPRTLEVVTSMFLEYLRTGKWLYSDNYNSTYCQESCHSKYYGSTRPDFISCHLIVGKAFFSDKGPKVTIALANEPDYGIVGTRRFNEQGRVQDDQEEAKLLLGMKAIETPPPSAEFLMISSSPISAASLSALTTAPAFVSVSLGEEDYKRGCDLEKKGDIKQAFLCYQKAAEKGHSDAQYQLFRCYKLGEGVEKNPQKAEEWGQIAAALGHPVAKGVCYHYGYGVVQSYNNAVKWYRKAADQGNANGQNHLGDCYYHGHGVNQDYKEAVKWFRKAADQGNVNAQYQLGICCRIGQGVAQDDKEAVNWFQKAADQGHADAQFNLGLCYYYGKGVHKDKKVALKWFQKAADQGDGGAKSYIEILKTSNIT